MSSRKKTAANNAGNISPNMIDIQLRKITHFQEVELLVGYVFACFGCILFLKNVIVSSGYSLQPILEFWNKIIKLC